jgi:hypothetical protein
VCGVRTSAPSPAAEALRVPNWSSTPCDLGVFVDQASEPIAASDVKLGR